MSVSLNFYVTTLEHYRLLITIILQSYVELVSAEGREPGEL
jgi:hypothetical protein